MRFNWFCIFRYDPSSNSYKDDMSGKGIIVLATDNLPTELAREVYLFGKSLSHNFLHLIIAIVLSC